MSKEQKYKQYFTPRKLAEYMIHMIPDDSIKTVVDLSMGECSLLEAAGKRWTTAKLYGADIDGKLIRRVRKAHPEIDVFCADSLTNKMKAWGGYREVIKGKGFDLVVANPPFNFYDQKTISICTGEDISVPIEIRFLFKYIDIVKEDGYISIILPYGFLSLDLYRKIRQRLLQLVEIINVIKVFENCFKDIDAVVCVLLIKKKKTNKQVQKRIRVGYLNQEYHLVEQSFVLVDEQERWDLEYQQLLKKQKSLVKKNGFEQVRLDEYVVTCKRGKSITKHKNFLSEKGRRFIHTTDLKRLYISNMNKKYICKNRYFEDAVLKENEVLIGRVGKGSIGKIGIVAKRYRNMYYSDCIFAIRTKNINPYYLALFLASELGQLQLQGIAKGSCSRYMTQSDLLKIYILVPDQNVQNYFGEQYKLLLSRRGRVNREMLFDGLLDELNEAVKKGVT